MSPRRLLYAADFLLRVLAVFLPRQRWRIQRIATAVRGFGGLLVLALAIHQAQLARLGKSAHTHHHVFFRRHVRTAFAPYRTLGSSDDRRLPRGPRHLAHAHYSGYRDPAGYAHYAHDRSYYRAPAPCPWNWYAPYRPCVPYPYQYPYQY